MPVLETHNLSIGYKKTTTSVVVQENINVALMQREVVCLIGPNGCGKSTLLRTLGGLQKALAGNIFINRQDFEELSTASKALLIGLVLTEPVSIGKMTVYEMVSLGRYSHTDWIGNLSEKDIQVIHESIGLVHLNHKVHEFFNELSDGEKQRVMIAKALAQDTPIVLLDEPTAHLDLSNRVEIMLLLRKLAKQTGKSVLLSTHELDLALQASDRIWLMQKEKITAGLPEELIINGKLQAVFQNKSFNFDEKTGNFILNYPLGKTIRLTGDETLCYWVKRALSREGYVIDSTARTTIHIENKALYVLEQDGNKACFTSLHELIEFLQTL
jgi:iron complex transport system ATP-binding protein